MNTIYFPAGTEYVQFGGLAQLIALASNPLSDDATNVELVAHGGARIHWETELLDAAKSGALPIKDSYTFGPCSYAVGYALQWSLVSIDDLRSFLDGRHFSIEVAPSQRPLNPVRSIEAGPDVPLAEQYEPNARFNIAKGRCTLHEAAEILCIEAGEDNCVILSKLEEAAKSGVLPVFDRGRNARNDYGDGARVRVFDTEARCTDLNKWLDAYDPDIKYRFPVPLAEAPSTSPVVDTPVLKQPQPNITWWQSEHDIHGMATDIGAVIYEKGDRPATSTIARKIAERINYIERCKGSGKNSPDSETVRKFLTGWRWSPE